MSKGGGGGQDDVTTTSEPWSGLQPYLLDAYAQAQNLYNSGGPEYYPNATYTPFSGQQELAMAMMENRALQGNPYLTQVQNYAFQNLGMGMPDMTNAYNQMNAITSGQYNNDPYRMRDVGGQVSTNWQAQQVDPSRGRTNWEAQQVNPNFSAQDINLNRFMNPNEVSAANRSPNMSASQINVRNMAPDQIRPNYDARNVRGAQIDTNGYTPQQVTAQQVARRQGIGQGVEGQLRNTMQGDYLNANPYLDQTYDRAASAMTRNWNESVLPGVNSTFSLSGRTGAGAHQAAVDQQADQLGRQLSGLGTEIYGQNYQQERERQQQATTQLGGFQMQNQAQNQQADLANQQAGLQAGLANQQAGYQGAQLNQQGQIANQASTNAARLANQQAGIQTNSQNLQAAMANQQAKLQAVNQRLQEATANQDAEMQARLSNQQARLQTNTERLQAQMANQDARLQSVNQRLTQAQSNQQAGLQTNAQNLQAQQGNQNAWYQQGQLNQNQALANQGYNMQAQLANQNAGMQANQMNQQGQFQNQNMGYNLANLNQQGNSQNVQNMMQAGNNLFGYGGQQGQYMNQLAQMAPGLGMADYYDMERLMGVGDMVRNQSNLALGDSMNRFNYYQNRPEQQMNQYTAWLSGIPGSQFGSQQSNYDQNDGSAAMNMAQQAIMAYFAASDVRLKKNIHRKGTVNGFNWYQWEWNDDAKAFGLSGPSEGVIAQEVLEVAPHLVTTKGGYLAVNYGGIV